MLYTTRMENLHLIDWRMVGFGALWITGLAVVLSALGFAYYEAQTGARRMREVLKRPTYQVAVNGGLTLFCLGLIGSSRTWWESLLWTLLAGSFAFFTGRSWRELAGT